MMSTEWYSVDSWQWTDNDINQWGFSTDSSGDLRQLWTDADYVYAATKEGLDIISIGTEERVSFVSSIDGYNSVWADENIIYIGSSNGIKALNKSDVGYVELFAYLSDYANYPFLSNNYVNYIHGNTNKLICCTLEGVDIIRKDSHYITNTVISGAKKCFVTPNYDYFYYTVSGTDNWSLCRLDNNTGNWTFPDRTYTTGSGFLINVTCINDFYVTEHTSLYGVDNTLFLATDNGVYVCDEGSGDYITLTLSQ